jgi:TolB-like protein
MAIWSAEIKELENLYESFKGRLPDLEKELVQLIHTADANVIMLYSRRCLEVIITDLCECELKRPRKTEPLKGIIDKLHKEDKVPAHIITSMHGLNELSTYGAHPKDFDPEQVKPVLVNLDIIIKWYLKYKETGTGIKAKPTEEIKLEIKSTGDLKKDITISRKRLAGLLGGLIGIIASVFAVLYFSNIIGSGKQTKELEKSIAVLPFRNDSPDSTNKCFIDGTVEAILDNLCKITDLTVISRTSVERFRNTTKSILEIAKRLNVNYIIEGSGQKYGNDIRLTVQLIDAVNDKHIWSSPYEGKAENIFKLQSQIAEAIATELKVVITPHEKQLIQKTPTANLEAYNDYLQGIFYWRKFTPSDQEVALKYFEQAIEKDPKYALAYAGISSVWVRRGVFGSVSPIEATSKAMNALTKALELDSTRAEVYRSLATIQMVQKWDWESAESSFKKAIALNPNYAEARILYGHLLIIVGRMKEAMEQDELALKLDPLNISFKAHHGFTLLFSRRYDDAITIYQEVLKTDPADMYVLSNLPEAFHMVGKYKEEFEAWKSYFTTSFKDFVHVFDQVNVKADYARILNLEADTLVVQSKTKLILPTEIALVYTCAGNKERAMDMLDRAYEMHDPNLTCLLHPGYDSLRSEPRFQALCKKMNLPYKLIE